MTVKPEPKVLKVFSMRANKPDEISHPKALTREAINPKN